MNRKQQNDLMQWRRSQVIELMSKGKNQAQIAQLLKVDASTINRDFRYLEENAKVILQEYFVDRLPLELTKALFRLNAISNEAWFMTENSTNDRDKLSALSLAQQATVNTIKILTDSRTMVETVLMEASNESPSLLEVSKPIRHMKGAQGGSIGKESSSNSVF